MFSKKIIDSGIFLEMPLSTQCLYFHLNMRADDEGVVDNVRQIMRMIGANEYDIKTLLAKAFLLIVDGEVVVIKDWYIHNTLKNDRTEESLYHNQLNTIYSINENKQYTKNGNILETKRKQSASIDKDRIDKDRLDKSSIDKELNVPKDTNIKNKKSFIKPTIDELKQYIIENGYDYLNAEKIYNYYEKNGWTVKTKTGRKKMSNWKLCVNSWAVNEVRYNNTNDLKNKAREAYIKDVELKTKQKETSQQRDDRNLKKLEEIGEKMLKEWNNDNTGNNNIDETNKNALTNNPNTRT